MSIDRVCAEVYEVPTDGGEADGTLEWSSTTMVVARVGCGTHEGLGWTYASSGAAAVIESTLAGKVRDRDPMSIGRIHRDMIRACRNLGRPGVGACAVSAVDIALWDLKAKLVDLPLADLFGRAVPTVPIYGSGGFTTYSDERTRQQLSTWVDRWHIPRVKIKIAESAGGCEDRDLERVRLARSTVGDRVELYVDANGGYSRKQAVRVGRALAGAGVTWFEEPVSSDDLDGLRLVRNRCDADVAAGEYGYTPDYFARMVAAGAVDCLQADATRCGGYTGWLRAAHVAEAHHLEISGHCAPNLHAPVAVAAPNLRHVEYFHDHYLIEDALFDGSLSPEGGALVPQGDRPGHGMVLRTERAEPYRANGSSEAARPLAVGATGA